MRNTLIGLLMLAGAAGFSATAHGQTASNKQIADEVIAIVKAEWAAQRAKNVTEALKNYAEEYTEFNGDYSTRLEGKALVWRLSEAGNKDPGVGLASEMANEKVQAYGDVAILSYNYVGLSQDKDGKVEPNRAKSTRIYAKQNGKWMLVHANFAPDPLPK